jgi:hypothetical protein
VFALALIIACGFAPTNALAQPIPRKTDLQIILENYRSTHQQFAREMDDVASDAELQGLKTEAAVIRERSARIDHQKLDIDKLPEEANEPAAAAPPIQAAVLTNTDERRLAVEKDYAARVYVLSQQAETTRNQSLAFHFLREVAFHDPDHEPARRALGFIRFQGKWVTPFAADQTRKGRVWDEVYGWLPADYVDRYRAGERYFNGRWMTVAQEANLRRDFDRSPWVIESEHFIVKTNHSLERGVKLSVLLEGFHKYFVRDFSTFFNIPERKRKLDSQGAPVPLADKHRVYYYASKEEFCQRLRQEPNIRICNGIYLPSQQIAHFFYDPANDDSHEETLYHEVTHQILSESTKATYKIAEMRDFWIIEGLACYMESFRQTSGKATVGYPLHKRIIAAQGHAAAPDEYIPMETFVSYGQSAFQTAGGRVKFMVSDLQRFYAQATAYSHFFIHYRDGIYREQFLQYLSDIYHPKPLVRGRVRTLEQLTGLSYAALDKQYQEYMRELKDREAAE